VSLSDHLESLGATFDDVIDSLGLPAWLVDANGTVLWLNQAARKLGGERRVSHYMSGVAPESRHEAQRSFSRKLLGVDEVSDYVVTVQGPDGGRTQIDASSVAVRAGERVVAIFGVGKVVREHSGPGAITLAPRLHETLRMLAAGKSTDAIAAGLGVTRESTRNYVRLLLKALDSHSRIEAVARGRELGLL
jgi:DNA-binding CsgD family transcriptional regulator